MSNKGTKSVKVSGVGINCHRCGKPTEIREHAEITEKILSQPFYYCRWYRCTNKECATTLIMHRKHKVQNKKNIARETKSDKKRIKDLEQIIEKQKQLLIEHGYLS